MVTAEMTGSEPLRNLVNVDLLVRRLDLQDMQSCQGSGLATPQRVLYVLHDASEGMSRSHIRLS